jgi:hypothetical protein
MGILNAFESISAEPFSSIHFTERQRHIHDLSRNTNVGVCGHPY